MAGVMHDPEVVAHEECTLYEEQPAAHEDVSEVLVCYSLGVYETQSNPQANRVIA